MTMTVIVCDYQCGKEIFDIIVQPQIPPMAGLAVIGWEGLAGMGWNSAYDRQQWIAILLAKSSRNKDTAI